MANLGSASVLIVPKFNNLTATVNKELGAAGKAASKTGEGIGAKATSGIGKGLAGSGAIIGAFSSLTSSAMSAISSHVGDAAARFDTLNNYPTTMQNLGYSAQDAEASISLMSDRLSSLPTTLDSMVSTVQGIAVVTGDLDQATSAGLALNDMLVASGSNTQLTTAAMEQFRQMLSKGKPDMQDWKSLVSAMPGQMDQLAKSMLGPTATANDLYTALGGGGADPTLTMDDLLNAMIKLDTEGGDSITSFKDQAETAAGGVQTSMANLSNAVTKGLTGMMDTVGKDNIAGVFNDLKGAVNDAFSVVNSVVGAAMPTVEKFYDAFKSNSGTITAAVATFAGLQGSASLVQTALDKVVNTNKKTQDSFKLVKTGVSDVVDSFSLVATGASSMSEGLSFAKEGAKTFGSGIKGIFSGLVSAIDPVSLAITGISAAISVGVAAYTDWQTKTENAKIASEGLRDVVADTSALSNYRGTIENVGTTSGNAALSIDDLNQSIADSVTTMQENNDKAQASIATLNTAEQIISECAGKTDLSTEAQGRLQWALQQVNEQLGTNLTANDVANNSYDQNGEHVDNLKEKISQLIEEKKKEAQVQAATDNLTAAYEDRTQAAKTLAETEAKYNDVLNDKKGYIDNLISKGFTASQAEATYAAAADEANKKVSEAKEAYDNTNEACKNMEAALGNAETTTSSLGDAMQALGDEKLTLVQAALDNNGQSLSALSEDLSDLGVNTDQFAQLSNDDLLAIANAYDGSLASITPLLEKFNVGLGNSAAKTDELKTALNDTFTNTEGLSSTFENLGWNMDDFSTACANAGLTAEDFSGMTAEQFAQLAQSCNGNMDEMIAEIASYNSTPLVDKDGNVNVTDNTLIDANGHIMTYNGTGLYDKTAGAYVNSAQVVDSTGNVWTWDGTALVSKSADATISGNAVTGDAEGRAKNTNQAIQRLKDKTANAQVNGNASDGTAATNIWNTVSAIGSLAGKTVTNTIKNITENITKGDAAGGIRPRAAGGIRYHANGAIVNVPGTGYPLDMVGEAGAEAIVPLTNKRYSLPFARTIAEQMGEFNGGGTERILSAIGALASAIADSETAVYVDGKKLASTIAKPMNQQLGKLAARGA